MAERVQLLNPGEAEYEKLEIRGAEVEKVVNHCDDQLTTFEERTQLLWNCAHKWGIDIQLYTEHPIPQNYPTMKLTAGMLASASTPALTTVADIRSLQQLSADRKSGLEEPPAQEQPQEHETKQQDQQKQEEGERPVVDEKSENRANVDSKTASFARRSAHDKMQKGELNSMDWIIKVLKRHAEDPDVSKVIQKLRTSSGGDLWEADYTEMPAWLQEQNSAYMQKKITDAYFLQKHRKQMKKAYSIRQINQLSFNAGDRVEIIKQGSQIGKIAMVTIPDWNGRVQVRMEIGDSIKSYMPDELKVLEQGFKIENSVSEHSLINGNEIDRWDFDILALQQKLLLRGSARARSRRLPRNPTGDVVAKAGEVRSVDQGGVHEAGAPRTEVDALLHTGVLSVVGIHLFHRHQCSTSLGIPDESFKNFLQQIEKMYNPCSYHNAMHGADAMRTIHYLFVASELGSMLTPLEKFAGLIAGAVHDVKHPGTNNNFVVATSHELAITYNDQSPLENMHCATAFQQAKETQIFDAIAAQSKVSLRKQIVGMVLDTDLARHFSALAKYKQRLKSAADQAGEDHVLGNIMDDSDGRLMAMSMVMKTAAKPWEMHEKWSKRVLLEFFAQGDVEKRRGMAVSSLCDRAATDVWNAQTGFIDFLAMPMFEAITALLRPTGSAGQSDDEREKNDQIYSAVVCGARKNRERWAQMKAEDADQTKYKDQVALRSTLFEVELGPFTSPENSPTM